jgi:predicted membrane protein
MTMREPSGSVSPRPLRPIVPDGRTDAPPTATGAPGWRMTPQLAIGLLIMMLGIVLMLDRFGVLEASRVLRFWPAGLMVMGGATWARDRSARGRFWGLVWIIIGSWLLLNTLGILQIGFWELFWPLVLILVGLKLVLHTARIRNTDRGTTGISNLFALMGGSKRSADEAPFHGGQVTAIMGGCILDLRRAIVDPGAEPVIDVFALMGGVELWVPGDWSIAADDLVPIMGGVEDKRLPPVGASRGSDPAASPARLRLRGHIIMGGLVIKTS